MDFDKEIENQRLDVDPQEQKVFCQCEECGGEIYVGEECNYDEETGSYIHEDCLNNYIRNFISTIKAGEE